MHEISLVQGLLDQLRELASENGAKRVVRVKVAIGPFSGVVVDSFVFGFKVLAPNSDFARDAVLQIERPLPSYRCKDCGWTVPDTEMRPESCPSCGGDGLFPVGGDELLLMQVEME